MSKILIDSNRNIFSCPNCHTDMGLVANQSLICKNKHCFDLAKSGYINFLNKTVNNDYNKEMLSARKSVMESGIFNPLLERISQLILPCNGYLLDAGCGEGTHLGYILDKSAQRFIGVGIDLSKSGILLASQTYKNAIWSVSDLASAPFKRETFSVILNILSPANYTEFSRILAKDGLLIKVIPNSGYLKELREIFYKDSDKETYSNNEVTSLFLNNVKDHSIHPINYKLKINDNLLANIIKMSPLSWKVSNEKLEQALNHNIKEITMDFTILKGAKPND